MNVSTLENCMTKVSQIFIRLVLRAVPRKVRSGPERRDLSGNVVVEAAKAGVAAWIREALGVLSSGCLQQKT